MISDVYFPRINGVSTSIQTFRRCLQQADHETVLIAPRYPVAPRNESEPGILRIDSRAVPRDPEDRMMKSASVRALFAELRARRFDVVHIQTPFVAHYLGLELARLLDVPAVETYHTHFEEYLHHYVPLLPRAGSRWLARHFTRSQCRSLDALIVPSRAMEETLRAYGVRCPMHIVPTGLDMAQFTAGDGAEFRRKLDIPPGASVLAHVGRIAHEKNIDFLLRMFARVCARLPEAVFIIAGEGPALEHCKHLVRDMGLAARVRFVGYLSRDRALWSCYRAGDVFVFASRTETQGLVLLEAMALGVPVVSTAHLGTLDILEPQRGAIIAPDDESAFANEVARLLSDPTRRAALAADAPSYAATWSAQAMTTRLLSLYASLSVTPHAGTELVRRL